MTRGVANDLTGRVFGHLKVVHRNGSDRQNNALWLCKCECGKEVSVRGPFLLKGQSFCSKQCDKYLEQNRTDYTGRRFGRLVAVSFSHSTGAGKSSKAYWRVKCDCGKDAIKSASDLIAGSTQSCGCFGAESRIKHGSSQTREYHREAHREWAKRNPAKVIVNAMNRTKALRQRIPPWLTEDHWAIINAFYREAARLSELTGIKHHVDHVHPLRGKTVSGLHVPWNLQVVTSAENLSKANSFSL